MGTICQAHRRLRLEAWRHAMALLDEAPPSAFDRVPEGYPGAAGPSPSPNDTAPTSKHGTELRDFILTAAAMLLYHNHPW
jgi:hypothetical protein